MTLFQELIPLNSVNLLAKDAKKSDFKAYINPSITNIDYLATTIQGSSISVYSIETLQCVYSYSIPPNSAPFTCPAVLAENRLFASYDKNIHYWEISNNPENHPVSRKVTSSLQQILVLENLGLCLVHQLGNIDIVDFDLNPICSYSTEKKLTVLYSTLLNSVEEDGHSKLVLVVSLPDESIECHSFALSKSSIELSSENQLSTFEVPFQITLTVENKLCLAYKSRKIVVYEFDSKKRFKQKLEISFDLFMDVAASKGNPGFSFCTLSSGCLAVLSQRKMQDILTVWDLKYGTMQSQKVVVDGSNMDIGAYQPIRSFCINSTNSETYGDIISIAVTGQEELNLPFATKFFVVPYFSQPTSLLAAIGKQTVSDKSLNKATYEGQLSMIVPIAPHPVKGQGNSVKIWRRRVVDCNDVDEEYLEKLIDSTKTTTVKQFQAIFLEWLSARNDVIRSWSFTKKIYPKFLPEGRTALDKYVLLDEDSPTLLPLSLRPHFSQKVTERLITRCFGSPKTFWPRAIIELLIDIGSVSSEMVPKGLMDVLIEKRELKLIYLCFTKVPDLTEKDLVSILNFTTGKKPDMRGCFKVWLEDRYAEQILINKKVHFAHEHTYEVTEKVEKPPRSIVGATVSGGQIEFLHAIFSLPKMESVFSHHMAKLPLSNIHVILQWLRQTLIHTFNENINYETRVSDRHPLWWLWVHMNPQFEHRTNALHIEYRKWLTAIDAFSLIIDTYIPTLNLTPELHGIIEELSVAVKRDTRLLQLYQSKLSGPLLSVYRKYDPEEKSRQQKREEAARDASKGYGKQWDILVDQMEAGVGEYSIEVWKF
ncbi:hypothetical protein BC833DRAFT_595100 [Globomyces pollinis-pini]|nr:hypothetical protein BC833DRAFT_595100 [Globomyces pollinis-pini]